MRTRFFLAVSYVTLIVDAYLVLASIATKMMKSQYTYYLPPFGSEAGHELSRGMVLLVATWTAVLSLGCINGSLTKPTGGSSLPERTEDDGIA